ncbi:MAG: hypothetical protein MUP44_04225, partial [Anaerolineales bacterium]|nr:hypothetical protein [Anaerolineales bacterium]
MKRFIWILGLAIGLAFALILFSFINRQRMGDMFDLAYDPTRDRLYSVAGESGLYTFEAEAGHLKRVSRFYDEGYYRNVEIQGERAYIAESERGLLVLDISSDRPRLVFASQDLRGEGIQLAGGLLYLAAGEDGLIIYSLADPDSPQEIGRYVHLEDARDVAVEGRLAYVADEPRGVEILDISSPTQPTRLGFVTWDPVYAQTEIVRAEGGFVYVAAGTYGLKFIDVRNPGSPVLAAGYIAGPNSTAEGLAVHAGIVYLTVRDPQDSS